MCKISKSPQRNTFQKEGYIKRCEKEGKEPNESYLDLFKTMKQQDEENLRDPEWQKDNLEYDLRSTEWICDKVKASDSYAQNLYAAMCNMQFQQQQVWPVLKDQRWSCSWRHAGGIVADMQEKGDYIDWYCSGIAGGDEPDVYTEGYDLKAKGFVPEGYVTDEIRADLLKLGWVAIEWKDEKT
jgi:hypothetical protein